MTDIERKEVELKPDDVIAFAVSIYESQGYPKNSFEMLDRELSRRFILQAEDVIKCGYAKFGKDNNGMEVCDTTATKRLAKACCKNCNTYPNNLGPCETFCQGGNERCVYCDHELKCHPIAWHLIENSQQPPKERKVSLEEIKIIKSVLDYYNLTEDGFYTDVISEEIAKRLNATEERKGE